MSEFHFLRPLWLLAFIPLVVLGWRLFRLGREGGDWRQICDQALLPYILIHDAGGKTSHRFYWLFFLGAALAVLALSGPVWERLPVPAFRNDSALVIALDLSRIMDAGDLKPSRLERARFKIADILKQRREGLTALLVYSGDAFAVTPLTDDVGTINSQLSALSSELMPIQGSRSDLALALAGRLLKQSGLRRGDVLLITNGVNLGKASPAAKELSGQGYRTSVLGAGSEAGAPVPLSEGGFLQDSKGNIIVSKLAAPALHQLADDGGGMYRKITPDNSDLSALLAFFDQDTHVRLEGEGENAFKVDQWKERGPWLLLFILPIAALAFRRGYLVILFSLILPLPEPAQALEWQNLWKTRDQQASQFFQTGDPARAAETFDNPAWKAAALYKAGEYAEAAKVLEGEQSADARYNLGNALAMQGRYPAAITAYDQALKLDPNNEDARHNKQLIEKALKDQKRQENERQSDKNQEQGQGQQKKNDQQQGQGQQKSEQSRGEEGKNRTGQPENHDGDANRDEGRQDEKGEGAQGNEREPQKNELEADEGSSQRAENREQTKAEENARVEAELRKGEDQQASEQWLRRIPDDPGGLLRRKFEYQYQQRHGRRENAQ